MFGAMTLILGAVFVNMVIAKINSSYNEVSRKGKLYYYKDIFDLRYHYKLDPKYGFLMTLDQYFSFLLLPFICVILYL